MHTPKRGVVDRFLQLVGRHVAASDAILATLGGRGIEAQAWKEAGVNPKNGWLIERDPELGKQLIRTYAFHHCGNLSLFANLFQSTNGKEAGVDGFHLDLCGTLEKKFRELRSVLSLVKKSRARCLAITVTEQRRNYTTEHFQQEKVNLCEILGSANLDSFLRSLQDEQKELIARSESGLNAEKAVQREMGIFLNLVRAITKFSGSRVILPDFVERYAYVSRYNRHPCRMKSYFFRLGDSHVTRGEVAKCLVDLWQKSKLFFYDEEFIEIPSRITLERTSPMNLNVSKLQALAEVVGGEALEQFLALKKAAENAPDANVVEQIRRLVGGLAPLAQPTTTPSVDRPQSARPEARPASRSSNGARVSSQVDDELDVMIDLIRAEAVGEEALVKAKDEAVNRLGVGGRKHVNHRRIVGGKYARTKGGLRPSFLKACLEKYGESIFAELAPLYTKINGQTVTETTLRNEAHLVK